jgi:NitT/TauT family transport system substrate-binding protein
MRGGGAAAAGLALILVAACGGPQPSALGGANPAPTATPDTTPVTVRVGHVASTAYAPLYVALDRGYFDRLHVKVDLVPVRAGQDAVDLVARGELDAAVADLSAHMFNALAQGQRFKVVGSMAALPPEGRPLLLEVAAPLIDSGQVRTLADLRGRTIAIAGGAGRGGGYLADLVLRGAGVSLKDLTVVDLAAASMEVAIASHGIDVALVPAPFTTALEQHGVARPMGAPPSGSSWSGLLYGTKLGTSAGRRFFAALVRAARDLTGPARTSDDTVTTLARYTGVPATVLKSVPPYEWDSALAPDSANATAMQATYRQLGLLQYEKDLPPARCIDPSYSKQAARTVR